MSRPDVPGIAALSTAEALAVVSDVLLPTLAKGILQRRPAMVGLAERWALDARAVRRFQKLHRKHGPRPLLIALPGRPQALVLSADDALDVLDRTPDPFHPASLEKQSALGHFEPHVALATRGPEREARRRFSDDVLASDKRCHPQFETLRSAVERAADALVHSGSLTWEAFLSVWLKAIRQFVLRDAAGEDEQLTGLLTRLSSRAN